MDTQGIESLITDHPPQNTGTLIVLDFLNTGIIHANAELTDKYLHAFDKIKSVANRFSQTGGCLITAQNTGGYFGVENNFTTAQALTSGLTGIVKTASHEWPKALCKAIDLNYPTLSPEEMAQCLYRELLTRLQDGESEVGYPDPHTRITLQTVKAPLDKLENTENTKMKKNSVFIVTGGARGITAACVIALGKKQPCRFALLGRSEIFEEPEYCKNITDLKKLRQSVIQHFSGKPNITPKDIEKYYQSLLANREIVKNIEALKKTGSEVDYYSADIHDKATLSPVLEQLRKKWGVINGIIHGAGVLQDKLIQDKTHEQFRVVFETKILGLENVLSLTQQDPLTHIALFSSVAGRYGNTGQADYACANEVLNKIAQYEQRHRTTCQVKSFNWAPWDSGMVDEKLKAMFTQKNIPILSVEQGAEFFVSEMMLAQIPQNNHTSEIIYGTLELEKAKTSLPQDNQTYFQVDSTSADYAFLESHQINQTPVIPAVLVLDWFLRCSKTSGVLKHFQVLKGIKLTQTHEKFSVTTESIESVSHKKSKKLKCWDEHHAVRYSAETAESPENPAVMPLPEFVSLFQALINTSHSPWPYSVSSLYSSPHSKGHLFHGKYFQAIKELLIFSDKGGSGILHSMATLNTHQKLYWPEQHWKTDILVLDGALQLLLLWSKNYLHKSTLPVSIEEIKIVQNSLPTEEVICQFLSHKIDNYRTKSDVVLTLKNSNTVYAALSGVQMCVIN